LRSPTRIHVAAHPGDSPRTLPAPPRPLPSRRRGSDTREPPSRLIGEHSKSPGPRGGPLADSGEALAMIRKLIEWAVDNPLIVLLLAAVLTAFGTYAFVHVNVEAYPDPAPAIIEVVAQYPGANAEDVERQVTVPLEVALAGMPGLKYTRSKSLAGLSHLRNQFDYGVDYNKARQEVINRLQSIQGLPLGVNPQIAPVTPTGELVRYTLKNPTDALGRPLYTLADLKALQDWVLEREFRRVPGIIDVTGFGGMVKRYEVRPDPAALQNKNL